MIKGIIKWLNCNYSNYDLRLKVFEVVVIYLSIYIIDKLDVRLIIGEVFMVGS